MIPLGIPVASTEHVRGAAFLYTGVTRDYGSVQEGAFKGMSRHAHSNTGNENIVKAVFYAIVVSVLASACFSGIGCDGIIHDFWARLCRFVSTPDLLKRLWNIVYPDTYFWMLPFSYLLFFTGYFYDEWLRSSDSSQRVESSQTKVMLRRRCEVLDVLAWCCFIIQVASIKILAVSAMVGILGCVLATVSLLKEDDWKWQCNLKFKEWSKEQCWIVQNVFWVLFAMIPLLFTNWGGLPLFGAIIILSIKIWSWWRPSLKTDDGEAHELSPREVRLVRKILIECEKKHGRK